MSKLTERDVIQDPEGAVIALRRADNDLYDARRTVEAFEHVFAAFDDLRRTGYVPMDYTPRWRARAEQAEAQIAEVRAIHQPRKVWESDRSYTLTCTSCQLSAWPCATSAVLDAARTSTEGENT